MINNNEIPNHIEFLADSMNSFKNKKFNQKKVTWIENIIREEELELYYLKTVDKVANNLILGFSEDINYSPIDNPVISEKEKKGITYREIESKDKNKLNFLWIDFEIGHFIFADRLVDGISIYKTNSRAETETMIVKQRWIIREEIRCIELEK